MDIGCAAAVVSGVYCRLSLVAVVLLSVLVVVIDSMVFSISVVAVELMVMVITSVGVYGR